MQGGSREEKQDLAVPPTEKGEEGENKGGRVTAKKGGWERDDNNITSKGGGPRTHSREWEGQGNDDKQPEGGHVE